jgi:hypothetical protein
MGISANFPDDPGRFGAVTVRSPSVIDSPATGASGDVPDDLMREAKAAFGLRGHGDVAALMFDSLVDLDAPPEDHRLRFEHPATRIEVQVSAAPDAVSLHGRVSPAISGRTHLQLETGDVRLVADLRDGEFGFGPVGHGIIRLHVVSAGRPDVRTDWFRI